MERFDRRLRENWDSRPASRESVQSAPASPAEVQGRWSSPPPSALSRFLSPSDDEVVYSDGEITELPTLIRSSSTEDLTSADEVSGEIVDRYPTPVSDGTYA